MRRRQKTRPYPLDTFGSAAGRFTEAIDPADARLRYLTASDDEAALRTNFNASARVLAFLEDKAGVALPPRSTRSCWRPAVRCRKPATSR